MFLIVYSVYGAEKTNDLDSDEVEHWFLKEMKEKHPIWTKDKSEAHRFSCMQFASLHYEDIQKNHGWSLPSIPVIVTDEE